MPSRLFYSYPKGESICQFRGLKTSKTASHFNVSDATIWKENALVL